MPLPEHRQRRLAQQVTARLPPRNFDVVRAGSEPFSVRAYLKRRVASDYDAEQEFIPTTAIILTPLDESPLREGDELGGYVVTQTLDSAGWLAYAGARLPVFGGDDTVELRLLVRQLSPSQAGGQRTRWVATEPAQLLTAKLRELEDEPDASGGVTTRRQVFEALLKGEVELNPTEHRLEDGAGTRYEILEARGGASFTRAKLLVVRGG